MGKTKNQILVLFLALAVVFMAPFKALSTPINAIPEDTCVVVSACCMKMIHCCCGPSSLKPATPADLNAAAEITPPSKFVAIKGSGKVVSQDLVRPIAASLPRTIVVYMAVQPPVLTTPLYILNRALLI